MDVRKGGRESRPTFRFQVLFAFPTRGTLNHMGRIMVPVRITSTMDPQQQLSFNGLVDTGAYGIILPSSWRAAIGELQVVRIVELETAEGRTVSGVVCGPVTIEIEGFDRIVGEVTFIDCADEARAEPLIGHTVLQLARAAVDMAHDRLVHVRYLDLKLVA